MSDAAARIISWSNLKVLKRYTSLYFLSTNFALPGLNLPSSAITLFLKLNSNNPI